jgi:hypothetical protein
MLASGVSAGSAQPCHRINFPPWFLNGCRFVSVALRNDAASAVSFFQLLKS